MGKVGLLRTVKTRDSCTDPVRLLQNVASGTCIDTNRGDLLAPEHASPAPADNPLYSAPGVPPGAAMCCFSGVKTKAVWGSVTETVENGIYHYGSGPVPGQWASPQEVPGLQRSGRRWLLASPAVRDRCTGFEAF